MEQAYPEARTPLECREKVNQILFYECFLTFLSKCAQYYTADEYCVFYNWYITNPPVGIINVWMLKDFTFSQKCVLIKTDAPYLWDSDNDTMWTCQRSNNMCRSVRCQPGLINRGEIIKSFRIKAKQFSIDEVVDVDWCLEEDCDWPPGS